MRPKVLRLNSLAGNIIAKIYQKYLKFKIIKKIMNAKLTMRCYTVRKQKYRKNRYKRH